MFQGNVCIMTNTPRRTHHLTPTSYAIIAKKKGSLRGFSRTFELNTWAELSCPLSSLSPALSGACRDPPPTANIHRYIKGPEWVKMMLLMQSHFRTSSGQAHPAPSWIFTEGILAGPFSAADWGERPFFPLLLPENLLVVIPPLNSVIPSSLLTDTETCKAELLILSFTVQIFPLHTTESSS